MTDSVEWRKNLNEVPLLNNGWSTSKGFKSLTRKRLSSGIEMA